MPVIRHAFQTFNLTRKFSVTDDFPSGSGEVSINVTLQNPPEIVEFKGEDVALIRSTLNVRMEKNVAESIMRGETLYRFKDNDEKQNCLRSIEEHERLPPEVEGKIMTQIARRGLLAMVKAHYELGLPPPIPLPYFGPKGGTSSSEASQE